MSGVKSGVSCRSRSVLLHTRGALESKSRQQLDELDGLTSELSVLIEAWRDAVFRAKYIVDDSISIVKESFDNDLTPYYALVVSIWGRPTSLCLSLCLLVCLSLWAPAQRKRATMLYFANVYLFIYLFFYGRLILRSWLTEVRENFTRGRPWVSLEKLGLGFFPGHP